MNLSNISTKDYFGWLTSFTQKTSKENEMKRIITFAILTIASADVSHLTRSYLPPVHSAHNTYSAPAIHYSSPSFVPEPAPIFHQTYSSPGVQYYQQPIAPAAVNEYLPPIQEPYTGPAVQTPYFAPSVSYSAPSFQQSYSAPGVQHSVDVVQHHSSAPVFQHYSSAPAVRQHFTAPSISYQAPVTQQTYSAPSVTYSSGSSGTQYASNGGYIYRRK